MKRTAVLTAGALALGLSGYMASKLWAQGAAAPAANNAAAAGTTRVAIVNLAYIFKYYTKCSNFQKEMKQTITEYEEKINKKKQTIEAYQKELAGNPMAQRKEEIERQIRSVQREAEDINNDAKKFVGTKSDAQMVIVYKEVADAVGRYAQAHAIDLVMHYTDVPPPDDAYGAMPIARKLGAVGCVPLQWSKGVDISYDVVMTLNAAHGSGAPATQPASR